MSTSLISAITIGAIYLAVPDILDPAETACFLIAGYMLFHMTLNAVVHKLYSIQSKRESLSCAAHRPNMGDRANKPVDVKIKKRAWKLILPAERVE